MVILPRVALNEEFSIQSRGFFFCIGENFLICYYIYMKSRKQILSLLASSIIFLCIINLVAMKGLWYYLFWYFDMPMHFLGGMAVLFLLVYVFYNQISTQRNLPIIKLLIGVLIIGIGWEVFEYVFLNWYAGQPFIILDVVSDLFFDTAGGILGLLYINKK